MKSLSTRRRHPLAGLLVLAFALIVMGGLYSTFRPAEAGQGQSDTALVAQGRNLFVVSCSTCHGLNGEGTLDKSGNANGPSLVGVGAAAVDFQVGTGRMPLANPGPQAPARHPVFTEPEVRALAAYIATLGPGPAIPAANDYGIAGLSQQDIAQGGEFFRTNCTACHNYAGKGGALPSGKYAPSLHGVDPRYVYEAMVTGPQSMPIFSDAVLKPDEKRKIIAYLKSLEDQTSYGGSSLGSLGPVTEGLWGWLGGIGVLVLATVWISNNGARARKKSHE